MKRLFVFGSRLVLAAVVLTARAQAPATSHDNPTPAKPTSKAPKGAKTSKTLGQKMVEKSKPTDDMRVLVRPAKQ